MENSSEFNLGSIAAFFGTCFIETNHLVSLKSSIFLPHQTETVPQSTDLRRMNLLCHFMLLA